MILLFLYFPFWVQKRAEKGGSAWSSVFRLSKQEERQSSGLRYLNQASLILVARSHPLAGRLNPLNRPPAREILQPAKQSLQERGSVHPAGRWQGDPPVWNWSSQIGWPYWFTIHRFARQAVFPWIEFPFSLPNWPCRPFIFHWRGQKMVSGKVRQNQTSQTPDQNGYTQPEMHKRSLKIIEGSFVHFFDNLFSMNAGRKSDPMHGS